MIDDKPGMLPRLFVRVERLEVRLEALGKIVEMQDKTLRKFNRNMVHVEPEDAKTNAAYPVTYNIKKRLDNLEEQLERLITHIGESGTKK